MAVDDGSPVIKAVFSHEDLLRSLTAFPAMRDPALLCGVPLTPEAITEIRAMESELQDAILLRCALHDYCGLSRCRDVYTRHRTPGASTLRVIVGRSRTALHSCSTPLLSWEGASTRRMQSCSI